MSCNSKPGILTDLQLKLKVDDNISRSLDRSNDKWKCLDDQYDDVDQVNLAY